MTKDALALRCCVIFWSVAATGVACQLIADTIHDPMSWVERALWRLAAVVLFVLVCREGRREFFPAKSFAEDDAKVKR